MLIVTEPALVVLAFREGLRNESLERTIETLRERKAKHIHEHDAHTNRGRHQCPAILPNEVQQRQLHQKEENVREHARNRKLRNRQERLWVRKES